MFQSINVFYQVYISIGLGKVNCWLTTIFVVGLLKVNFIMSRNYFSIHIEPVVLVLRWITQSVAMISAAMQCKITFGTSSLNITKQYKLLQISLPAQASNIQSITVNYFQKEWLAKSHMFEGDVYANVSRPSLPLVVVTMRMEPIEKSIGVNFVELSSAALHHLIQLEHNKIKIHYATLISSLLMIF